MAAPRVIARQASSPRACSCSRVDPNAPGASASAASRTARHARQSSSPRRITVGPAERDGSGSLVMHPHLARSQSILAQNVPDACRMISASLGRTRIASIRGAVPALRCAVETGTALRLGRRRRPCVIITQSPGLGDRAPGGELTCARRGWGRGPPITGLPNLRIVVRQGVGVVAVGGPLARGVRGTGLEDTGLGPLGGTAR